jgi:hypothetical protein
MGSTSDGSLRRSELSTGIVKSTSYALESSVGRCRWFPG